MPQLATQQLFAIFGLMCIAFALGWRIGGPMQHEAKMFIDPQLMAQLQCMALINWIRNEHEGWSLILFCDNPDFEGERCAIEVEGHWSHVGWTTKRFNGDSFAHCLQQAKAAMIAHELPIHRV